MSPISYSPVKKNKCFKDLSGKRFGRLFVIECLGKIGNRVMWLCRCDCGNEKPICSYNFNGGHTTSCGCVHKENTATINRTHGKSKTRTYRIWANMLTRCSNQNVRSFPSYGGRGIRVCDEWRDSFDRFLKDMGECPNLKSTLERRNVNGNYSKQNCFWIDGKLQPQNKTTTIWVDVEGEKKCLMEASEHYRIPYATLYQRFVLKKWDFNRAITQPIKR